MASAIQDGRLSAAEGRLSAHEQQISYLTGRLDKAENKLDSLGERLTRLEERVAHLPSKESIVKIAFGTVAAIGSLIAFQGKIQSLLGITPHP